jgi:hypothetical protein
LLHPLQLLPPLLRRSLSLSNSLLFRTLPPLLQPSLLLLLRPLTNQRLPLPNQHNQLALLLRALLRPRRRRRSLL